MQFARCSHQRRNIVPNHLGDDWPPGRILSNRFENMPIETGSWINSKIFCEVDIRSTIRGHQPPERQIGHVLHWREGENGLVAAKQPFKYLVVTHTKGAGIDSGANEPRIQS